MQLTSLLFAATVVSGAFARVLDVPANVEWLALQSGTQSNEALNGAYLSVRNGKLGLYQSDRAEPSKAAKVFSTKYASSSTLSLHVADDTHQIALQGSNGLLELVDVVNPTGDSIPRGQSMEWSTFVIENNVVTIKDGADIPSRKWVAVDQGNGDYTVALYDGYSQPQPKPLVDINLFAIKPQ